MWSKPEVKTKDIKISFDTILAMSIEYNGH